MVFILGKMKIHRASPIKKRGMTLIEILVTIAIFASAFIYISKMLKFHLRQQKKISHRIEASRIKENVLEIIREDLKGALFFYDINFHFTELYPVLETTDDPLKNPAEQDPPVNIMEPQFDFSGQREKLKFISIVRLPASSPEAAPRAYVVKVKYFLRNCKSLQTGRSSRCLARGISRSWKDMEDEENQDILNLQANVKDLEFSYFERGEWHKEWSFYRRWYEASQKPTQTNQLLPGLVKLRIEWGREKLLKTSYNFAVSYPVLRSHYPGSLSALAFLDIGRKDKEKEQNKPLLQSPGHSK